MFTGHPVNYATTRKGIIKAPNTDYTPCYACDEGSVGVAERRNGDKVELVYACKRHSNSSYKVTKCCIYCGDPTQRGALMIDGDEAHQKCFEAANSD